MYEVALAFAVFSYLFACGYFWRSPAFSMFHPLTFYLAFHGILFVVRPIIAWVRDYKLIYFVYSFTPTVEDKATVLFAAALGMLCFTFFSLRAGPEPMRFAEDRAIIEERRRLTQIFIWVVLICGPLAVYSLSRNFTADSNYEGLKVDASTGVTINTQRIGYITDLQLMAVSLSALTVWLARFRLWSLVPLIAFITLRAGSGGRGPFIGAMVSAALFFFYEKRIRYPGVKIAIAIAMTLSFFTFVGHDRGATVREAIGLQEKDTFTKVESKERFLEGMDFGNMEYFEYLVYVIPQRSGTYDYFLDNFQLFTEPVPRILWSGKPVGEPFRRIWLFQYGYPVGMTRSLPGEGWYALGWLGVIIWCSLWGHALGRIYSRFVTGSQSTFRTACYMIFLPTLVVALRDGGILTVVRQSGVYLTPVFVWFLIAKYTGIPSAAQLRALLARKQAEATGAAGRALGDAGSALSGKARRMAHLPAAVIRRRLFLEQNAASQTPAE